MSLYCRDKRLIINDTMQNTPGISKSALSQAAVIDLFYRLLLLSYDRTAKKSKNKRNTKGNKRL